MEKEQIVSWKSPSNIAFIKYWGKYGRQLPCNPSFSMALNNCYTITTVSLFEKTTKDKIELEFTFHKKNSPNFTSRILNYLNGISNEVPFVFNYKLKIDSENSFPHSAGIASSASAFSALALCLLSLQNSLSQVCISDRDFHKKASELARLGSGSASRSVYGNYSVWGKHEMVDESSDNFAIPFQQNTHSIFQNLHDYILITDAGEKEKSSSAGHALMMEHPYAEARYEIARKNLGNLLNSMKKGDFRTFSNILEHEALSLHGLMMMANPWYTLLSPNALKIIQEVKKLREQQNVKIAFTLDAGPNVHLLFPEDEKEKVSSYIDTHLLEYCFEGRYIKDTIGTGPKILRNDFQKC